VNPGQQAVFISTSTSADIVRWSKWRNATLQIKLHLVLPPSANQLWTRTRKGLRKTDRYTLWLAAAGWTAKAQRPDKVTGPYKLMLTAVRPDNRKRDLT